jgi:hypothetical protein
VAYFLPPDWGRIALHAAPALERGAAEPGDTEKTVRLLILVPDAGAALALTRALALLPAATGRRLLAATSATRVQRLLATGVADAVIGTPETIAAGLGTTLLKLDTVTTVLLAAADELDADSDALAAVMSEVPKDAARILTALKSTTGVEALLERYLHRVRRVTEDVEPAEGSAVPPTVRYLTVSGAPIDALPLVLDELDAPSATVLVGDERAVGQATALLRGIGYHDGALARVSAEKVAPNSALVVTLGVPTATAWQAAVAAQPAQIVALIAPRELPALRLLSGSTEPRPLADRASISRARAVEARRRAELRAELGESIPSREVLALEPLLREYDGLEIAAAALRLLERTRESQAELVIAAEHRVRTIMKEAQREKDEAARGDAPRPFKPRGEFKPRSDRPRADGPRGDYKPRGDKPRGFAPRSDKPRGQKGPPRGDR